MKAWEDNHWNVLNYKHIILANIMQLIKVHAQNPPTLLYKNPNIFINDVTYPYIAKLNDLESGTKLDRRESTSWKENVWILDFTVMWWLLCVNGNGFTGHLYCVIIGPWTVIISFNQQSLAVLSLLLNTLQYTDCFLEFACVRLFVYFNKLIWIIVEHP